MSKLRKPKTHLNRTKFDGPVDFGLRGFFFFWVLLLIVIVITVETGYAENVYPEIIAITKQNRIPDFFLLCHEATAIPKICICRRKSSGPADFGIAGLYRNNTDGDDYGDDDDNDDDDDERAITIMTL